MKYITDLHKLRKTKPKVFDYAVSLDPGPLAVMLVFDLLSYEDLTVDVNRLEEIRGLRSEYKSLTSAQIWLFWRSWSLGKHPSRSLEFLRDSGWLDRYPELFGTIGTIQNPETHPEGDVFNHILHAADYAATIAEREGLDHDEKSTLVFAALCHDLGKQESSYESHEEVGVAIADRFLSSIFAPSVLKEKVKKLTRYHGADYQFHDRTLTKSDITKDFVKVLQTTILPATIPELVRLHEADMNGRAGYRPFGTKISENYRRIYQLYSDSSTEHITREDFYRIMAKNDTLSTFSYSDGTEILFRNSVNRLIDNGYFTKKELEYYLPMIFTGPYLDALLYVSNLDYRGRRSLSDYIDENGADLDSILLKGKSHVESILNQTQY